MRILVLLSLLPACTPIFVVTVAPSSTPAIEATCTKPLELENGQMVRFIELDVPECRDAIKNLSTFSIANDRPLR